MFLDFQEPPPPLQAWGPSSIFCTRALDILATPLAGEESFYSKMLQMKPSRIYHGAQELCLSEK